MKKTLLLGCMLLCLISVNAQKEYFFYFQSENNTAFFLKINDKVYSANPEGYLILPRLLDSSYTFTIGKNGAQATEARFTVPVNQKDRGFLIREVQNKFQLFDMQSMRTIQPQETASRAGTSFIRKEDPFTRLLALAADDTSLLYVYTEPEKQKAEPPAAVVQKTETETIKDPIRTGEDVAVTHKSVDTSVRIIVAEKPPVQTVAIPADTSNTQTTSVKPPLADSLHLKPPVINPDARAQVEKSKAEDTVVQQPEPAGEQPVAALYYKKSVVMRKSESSTTEGFGLVFLDSHEAGVDTISILIPNPRMAYQKTESEEALDSKKFLDVTATTTTTGVTETIKAEQQAAVKKTACRATATNADFLKLRRYMAAKTTEEDMVTEAKKYFRTKCFATEQIKHLSSLFLTDRGKFLFFDAAYPFVTDQAAFPSLQSEITDRYFIDRFGVLIGN